MKDIQEKIEKLDTVLRANNAPILNYFNRGLSRENIVKYFIQRGIVLRPELIPLYEWHNGIDFEAANVLQPMIEIMPMGIPYTLDYMISTRENLIRWDYIENSNGYLPLFGSGEDDLYLLKNETGEVFYLAPASLIICELQFKSIDAMLDCLIESYEESILKIDPNEGLNVLYEEFENKKAKYR